MRILFEEFNYYDQHPHQSPLTKAINQILQIQKHITSNSRHENTRNAKKDPSPHQKL